MNAWVILAVIVGMLYAVLFVVLMQLGGLGLIIFFIVTASSFITLVGAIIVREMGNRVMFPMKLRLWEPRRDGPIITVDTRAKMISKKDYEYFVTPGGKRIKAPPFKYIIRGEKNNFMDLITPDGETWIPFNPKYKIDPDKKGGKANLFLMPEDQRVWLADQIEESVKITTPPLDTLAKIIPIITMVTAVGILLVVFMVFTDQMPKFMEETSNVMKAQINALDKTVDKFTDSLDKVTLAPRDSELPGEPPPGF